MKYSREQVKAMTPDQYTKALCMELNNAGFKVTYNDGSTSEFEPSWDVFELCIAENPKAVQYLREIGLIDNGKCPLCSINEDDLQYRQRNPKSGEWYHICKSCYKQSVKRTRTLKGLRCGCCLGMIAIPIVVIWVLFKLLG